MKGILIFFFCAMSSLIGAQSASNQFGWGTLTALNFNNSIKLNNGDVVLSAGSISGINGNKNTENYGNSDLWLTRINSANNVLWQKSFGGTLFDDRGAVNELLNGDLLITCSSNSPISGNKTVNTNGDYDFWVLKTNSFGDILWQKSFGTTGLENIVDLIVISDTLFCLIGSSHFQGINGDKTENSSGNVDYWILMIDGNGNKVWDRTIGGTAGDIATKGIYNFVNEQIYVVGTSTSGIGGLKTEVNYGDQDIWLVSLDLNGNIVEQKSIGGSGYEEISDLTIDNQGNVLIAIGSDSDISGTKTQNSFGSYDAWLVKLNSNLEIIGDYTFGGSDIDNLNSIIVNDNGQLVLACSSASDVSGNKSIPLKGISDCWFIGLNATTMEIEWEKVIGGSLIDSPLSFWETSDSYKVVSMSSSPISIDKTVSAWGESDFWVYEFSKTVGVEELVENSLIYPNPCLDYLTIQSSNFDNFSYSISDANGRVSKQGNSTANAPISVMELVEGVYFITLKQENETEITHRFVKG